MGDHGACGVLWPVVCPICPGVSLLELPANRWGCPRCRREWPEETRVPCQGLATVIMIDGQGRERIVCASHAVSPHFLGEAHWVQAVRIEPGPAVAARAR